MITKNKNISFFGAGIVVLVSAIIPFAASAATLDRQLEIGMSGNDVSILQTFLAQDSSIYPQGLVTGYFGPLTQAAVINFQARNSIATVGRVGPVTLAAINAQMNNGKTVGFDRVAPIIGSVTVAVTSTGVTLDWNTNEAAAAIVYYSTAPILFGEANASKDVTVSGVESLVHTDFRLSHSATITGINPNTTYHYVVYVRDSFGNVSVTIPSMFKTLN